MTTKRVKLQVEENGFTETVELGARLPLNGSCESMEGDCDRLWGPLLAQVFVPRTGEFEWWCAECFVKGFLSSTEGPWRLLNVHEKPNP